MSKTATKREMVRVMFKVESAADAWELGVLYVHDFVDGSGPELGVPGYLQRFFAAGCKHASSLTDERVDELSRRWSVALDEYEGRLTGR